MRQHNTKKEKTYQIAMFFGKEPQTKKAVEELAELIIALSKGKKDNIIEEIADVEIMLEQIKFLYDLDSQAIANATHYKIDRTLKLIKNLGGESCDRNY